jgi:hypothetical protein
MHAELSGSNFIHLSFSNWSFIGAFHFIKETIRTEELILLTDGHFRWWFPTTLRRNLLCNVITDFNSWYQSTNLAFPAFRTPFSTTAMMAPLMARLVNSGKTIPKHHITYLDTWSFHFCTFQFISNITLKFLHFMFSPCSSISFMYACMFGPSHNLRLY